MEHKTKIIVALPLLVTGEYRDRSLIIELYNMEGLRVAQR